MMIQSPIEWRTASLRNNRTTKFQGRMLEPIISDSESDGDEIPLSVPLLPVDEAGKYFLKYNGYHLLAAMTSEGVHRNL